VTDPVTPNGYLSFIENRIEVFPDAIENDLRWAMIIFLEQRRKPAGDALKGSG
jgi:hypothetical protein